MRPPGAANGGWHLTKVELTTKNVVALATADGDFGHVPADTAKADIANEKSKPVTLRDPVTDRVLGTIRPAK